MPDNQGDNRRGRWQGWDFGGGGSTPNRSPWRFSIIYIAAAVILLLVVQGLFRGSQLKAASLNQFYTQLSASNLQTVNIATDSLTWTTKDGAQFKATLPSNFQTQGLVQQLAQAGVRVTASQPSAWAGFLAQWLIPIFIFALIWIFLMRRIAGGGAASALNLGKNRVKIYDRKEMKTTFSDVAGLDEAVEELKEIVEFLKYPKKYQRLGGRIPKGVLLLGPPGCGKTLLARAVAGEAAVPFFFMSGSEFVEMFVGLGAARVRELFNQAKERAPCLVFLDELDTIGKSRAGAFGGSFGSHDEREQTLNQLLVEMDGFDSSKGVIIMAATNRADVLDPALVRPGRFDRQVVVDRPDLRGREAILRVHTRGVAVDPSDDLHVLAARTPGFTGADLANVVNEAALLAARREKNSVGMEELEEAIDRTVAGLERKSRVMSEKEKVRVATHEMGHALAGLRLQHIDPVHRVTIIPRGAAALGITMTRPLEDRYLMTEPELLDRLVFALGGRTAEEIVFGEISTGAADDLHRATDIARAMVVEFGMSPRLGPLSFGEDGFRSRDGRPFFPGERPEMSDETARVVDAEVARLVNQAHDRAKDILERDVDLLHRLSDVLVEREAIDGKELLRFVEGKQPIPTKEELLLETKTRREEEQAAQPSSGPDLIRSASSERASEVAEQIPARPDWA
ncbi:MAG TPA: ATP-dependent zinc metalloprotease FtsH [Actinomycetota bacterium]|nr:ATP-dependent zinc metalloprotease FtsH [Actinomycetota bacterium]